MTLSTVSTKPASSTLALFHDESFSFETLRALAYAPYGGADIGEVTSTRAGYPTATRPPGTPSGARSPTEYTPTPIAAPPKTTASAPASPTCERATTTGSARSTCASIRRMTRSSRSRTALGRQLRFRRATDDPRADAGEVSLRGHHAARLVDSSRSRDGESEWWRTGRSRPILLFHGGFDSTEENCTSPAAPRPPDVATTCSPLPAPDKAAPFATRNCSFARTGRPSSPGRRLALDAPDVDPNRIALMGMSFGGLLAPRAAAAEHRVAALIAYDGLYSFADAAHFMVGPRS